MMDSWIQYQRLTSLSYPDPTRKNQGQRLTRGCWKCAVSFCLSLVSSCSEAPPGATYIHSEGPLLNEDAKSLEICLRTHLHVLSNHADILPDILGDHGTVYSRLGYGRIHLSFLHCNSRSHGFPLFPAKISYFHVPRAYTCFILSLIPNLETRLGLHRPG